MEEEIEIEKHALRVFMIAAARTIADRNATNLRLQSELEKAHRDLAVRDAQDRPEKQAVAIFIDQQQDEIRSLDLDVREASTDLEVALARVTELEEWKRMYETGTIGFVLNAAEKIDRQNERLKVTLTHIALESGIDAETLQGWALGCCKEEWPQDFDPDYKEPADGVPDSRD